MQEIVSRILAHDGSEMKPYSEEADTGAAQSQRPFHGSQHQRSFGCACAAHVYF